MSTDRLSPSSPPQDTVTPEWIDSHLPGVFARGHQWLVVGQQATIDAVIEAAAVEPGDHALDIGGGSGIPTLELARRVGPSGRVIAVEPSPVLIDAMTRNVEAAGLENVDIVQGSAADLPFPEASFDAATCHFAAMFFPDLRGDLASIRRVLRPGARAAFAGWGPLEDNTHLQPFFGILARHLGPRPQPANPREAPWPMRFAEAGTLAAALEAAGYEDVREEQPTVRITWPGPPETLKTFWMEMANPGPEVSPDTRAEIERDILAHLHSVADDAGLHFTARVTVGSGRAPA